MTHDKCPHCGVSLIGEPIPVEHQEVYGATHFRREMGISDLELDIIIAYQCPDCGGEWWRNGTKKRGESL